MAEGNVMLLRLIIVCWWLGALSLVASVVVPRILRASPDECRLAKLATEASAKQYDAAVGQVLGRQKQQARPSSYPNLAAYIPEKRPIVSASDLTATDVDRAAAEAAAIEQMSAQMNGAARNPSAVGSTDEPPVSPTGICLSTMHLWIAALLGVLIAVLIWSLCFVLGGSFWLPPKIKAAQ